MTTRFALVRRVGALARLPDRRRREEVERELSDHLEDLIEEARRRGYDETMARRMAAIRFGDPGRIAEDFNSVYAFERLSRRTAAGAFLLFTCLAATSLAVVTVQLSAATLWMRTLLPNGIDGLYWEFLGFCSIAAGYCCAYLGQRLFRNSIAGAVSLSVIVAVCVATGLFSWAPGHALLPTLAFASAASARLLQGIPVPFLWFAGTAGPIAMAALAFRPLLPERGPPPWLLWIGLTLSCATLRGVVNLFSIWPQVHLRIKAYRGRAS